MRKLVFEESDTIPERVNQPASSVPRGSEFGVGNPIYMRGGGGRSSLPLTTMRTQKRVTFGTDRFDQSEEQGGQEQGGQEQGGQEQQGHEAEGGVELQDMTMTVHPENQGEQVNNE